MPDDSYLHGDRAAEVDLLDRGRFAELLAADILSAPADGGFVFALMGPYGSGKTTVLDLVRQALDSRATIVSFEPWMIGSADQLIGRFFKTFAASMRRSGRREIRDLAEKAEKYGQLAGPLGKVVGTALDVGTAGMASRRHGRLASEQAYWAYATATERDRGPVPGLLDAMEDEHSFKDQLDALVPELLNRVVDELRDYTGDFTVSAVGPTTRALCSQLDRTAHLHDDFFGPVGYQIMSLVGDLVRRLDEPDQPALVEELATSGHLSARFWVLKTLGSPDEQEDPEMPSTILDLDRTKTLKQRLADDVAKLPIDELTAHPQFLLFLGILRQGKQAGRLGQILHDDTGLPKTFASLMTRWFMADSQGERVRDEVEFAWKDLVALAGGKDEAEALVEQLEARRETLDADQLQALDQAKRYCS